MEPEKASTRMKTKKKMLLSFKIRFAAKASKLNTKVCFEFEI